MLDPEIGRSLNELAVVIISGITTIVLPMAYRIGKSYAEAKIAAVQNKDARAALEFALDRLSNTARTVVVELNAKSKTMNSEGKLAPDIGRALLATAYKRVGQRLPLDVADTLKKAYGENYQPMVVGQIESAVECAKPR